MKGIPARHMVSFTPSSSYENLDGDYQLLVLSVFLIFKYLITSLAIREQLPDLGAGGFGKTAKKQVAHEFDYRFPPFYGYSQEFP